MKISTETCAVVVTYNRKEKLRKCLDCVLNQSDERCDVILVDNDSTDGTEEMILEEYNIPSIHYYNTGVNLGGAGGFEYGVKEAVLKGYEYIWIMDDDTWPDRSALHELFQADKVLYGDWGFLSSVAYWVDGSICRMNIQKKNIFTHVSKREYMMDYVPIKMCSFVSLLVKSSVVKNVGLPIGEYFIWTDDYEFTGRISRNHKCYMVTKSHVVHAMKNHTRVNFAKDDSDRIDRYKYIYRNDIHCYKQYGVFGWMYILLKGIYTCINIIFNSKVKKEKIIVLFKGIKEGLTFNPIIKKIE